MTSERFKEIYERNRHNSMIMLYTYFCEEKGSNIDVLSFQNDFTVWVAFKSFGDVNGGMIKIVEYLKNKHK